MFYVYPKNHTFTEDEIDLIYQSSLEGGIDYPSYLQLDDFMNNQDAISLGELLFHDANLSKDKYISCASCHEPKMKFHDVNNETQKKWPDAPHRAPSLIGVYAQPWFFWDGRADTLWGQVLSALESENEHNGNRVDIINYICSEYYLDFKSPLNFCNNVNYFNDDDYARNFVKVGKVISSYLSTLKHQWTRFDEFAKEIKKSEGVIESKVMSYDEIEGMKLFFDRDKTGCIDCHSGRRFTNNSFAVIGTSEVNPNDRANGINKLEVFEFKCEIWEREESCQHYKFMKRKGIELKGAYKVPSLRNLADSPSFMHNGYLNNLEEVIDLYTNPLSYPITFIDVKPLRLLPHQRKQLIKFLEALNDEYK